jgi:hypothetical protein
MSSSWYSSAVIGCGIDESKIPTITKNIKAFEHNMPEDSLDKFDSKTGKPLWVIKKFPEYSFREEVEDKNTKIIDLKGLQIYTDTDYKHVVLGFGCTASDWDITCNFRDLCDINEIKEKLKSILEPINMWDGSKFGLYSILRCSY